MPVWSRVGAPSALALKRNQAGARRLEKALRLAILDALLLFRCPTKATNVIQALGFFFFGRGEERTHCATQPLATLVGLLLAARLLPAKDWYSGVPFDSC